MNTRGFASDNNAGISPEVIRKIEEVNKGHVVGYGDDPYTARAVDLFKEHFGHSAIPYFVFTGTAANVLSITAGGSPFKSVFCAETAHIQVDECGAPERFAGCKLIPIPTQDGKITPAMLEQHMVGFGFEHHAQPGIISISQSTEMGTVYQIAEIEKLADFAHKYGLILHVDGARLANAAVSLDLSLKEMTDDAGVDIVSFGGTKNGLMAAESVIFFREDLTSEFKYIRKQGMQLASKMRFIAAQFIAYLEDDLWQKNADHANRMAQKLYLAAKDIPQVKITQKVEANGLFAIIPKSIIPKLQKEFFFYVWNEERGEVRWMTSFDTTEEDIENFVKILIKNLSSV
jgi:threonine aldolase